MSGTVPGADVAGAIRARALRGTVAEGDSLRGSGHVTARRAARESREPRHVTGAFTAGELAVGQARSWGPRTRTPRGPRSGPRPAPPPLGGESGLGLPEPRFPHLRAADQEAERTEVRRGAGSGGPGVTASPAGVAAAPRWATASEFKSSVLPRGWPETAFFSHRLSSHIGKGRGGVAGSAVATTVSRKFFSISHPLRAATARGGAAPRGPPETLARALGSALVRGPARSRFLGTSQEPWVTGRGRRPDFDRNPCRAPGPGAGATLTGVASGSWSEPPAFLSVGQERSQLSGSGHAPWPLGPQPGPRFLGRLPV